VAKKSGLLDGEFIPETHANPAFPHHIDLAPLTDLHVQESASLAGNSAASAPASRSWQPINSPNYGLRQLCNLG